jgi:hypothetical protein
MRLALHTPQVIICRARERQCKNLEISEEDPGAYSYHLRLFTASFEDRRSTAG